MRQRCLRIESVSWSAHQLVMRFALDELRFSSAVWYPDVDLVDLDRRYGRDFMERVHAHTALFSINTIASLRPAALDLGPCARHATRALESLWHGIFDRVWAQWRFENDLPDARGPVWLGGPFPDRAGARARDRHAEEVLLYCGGGKDSLVSMKLLERGRVPFASLAYASSAYGAQRAQFALSDALLDHGVPVRRHRQVVLDDFGDAPVLDLYGPELGVRTTTSAETPRSIFAALPVLLDRGYRAAVLGHEASANSPNFVWERTGEAVNHQWGKSLEAETLLAEYVRSELVSDVDVFSLLMPIHDVVIFELLRRDEGAARATHSCNVRKPWCLRCPKCAYVWLGFRAHLESDIFSEDLLEVEACEPLFRDLLGLGAHKPFECVGEVDESRLALELCRARGRLGPRGAALARSLPRLDASAIERFLRVDYARARVPPDIEAATRPLASAAADAARARISGSAFPEAPCRARFPLRS